MNGMNGWTVPDLNWMRESQKVFAEIGHARSAEGFAERLIAQVREFEKTLDEESEVGIRLVSFGQAVQFHVAVIGWMEPSLIVFAGFTDEHQPVQLVQHVNQISFLLMRAPRLDPDKPREPIGFKQSG